MFLSALSVAVVLECGLYVIAAEGEGGRKLLYVAEPGIRKIGRAHV